MEDDVKNEITNLSSDEVQAAKIVIKSWFAILLIMTAAYAVEFINGSFDNFFYIGFVILGWGSFLIAKMFEKQGKYHQIKHVLAYGYGFFYSFILYYGRIDSTYAYVFPVLVVVSVFQDFKYTIRVGVMCSLAVLGYVVMRSNFDEVDVYDIAEFKIMVVITVGIVIFSVITTKGLIAINESKLISIKEQQERQKILLDSIVSSTSTITDEINFMQNISSEVLKESSNVNSSMNEVLNGATETATTLQEQLVMTGEIEKSIDESADLSKNMEKEFQGTIEQAETGRKDMTALEDSSKVLVDSNDEVVQAMDSLTEKMEDARKIIELINQIADQTTLLSLNASIEAARAGEAGKGFAVVANEIQKLAHNTQDATSDIAGILDELGEESENAINAIQKLTGVSDSQTGLIKAATERFEEIEKSIASFSKQVKGQSSLLNNIKTSTKKLNSGIEAVSSFSEELMASTETTRSISEKTSKNIKDMTEMVNKVSEEANKLRMQV